MTLYSENSFCIPSISLLTDYLKNLRDTIITNFETFEPTHRFKKIPWNHPTGGGGEIATLRGDVFEKAAVNFSAVSGDHYPLNPSEGHFFATGVSLITHMKNPHAPTVHMNIRFIQLKDRYWFGGGYDLTPMGLPYEEDTLHFHKTAQEALQEFPTLYETFSKNAKDYFFIPHREKERGVGGIFFDYLNTGHLEHDIAVWKSAGESFLKAILPIYQRRIYQSYSLEDVSLQQKFRGHYVEFNLLYDRGTKFGFQSGGNKDAILSSMPPLASW